MSTFGDNGTGKPYERQQSIEPSEDSRPHGDLRLARSVNTNCNSHPPVRLPWHKDQNMKVPNQQLKNLDQEQLKKSIADNLALLIWRNLDHWCSGADMVKRNERIVQRVAKKIANDVVRMIVADNWTQGHPPRLLDLTGLLGNAASQTIAAVHTPDGSKKVAFGENPNFVRAVAGCAYRVLVDLLIEDAR